ncbi:MAG: helix-turn-helix domain-containing protein [Candidatus Thermoplasmatota archaeon]|nr:helix-turn-helix domain-containing protein [Candidatus Thermoplasmatota archaeon]
MLQNEALQHKTRKRIYDQIAKNPGVSFNMLASILDLNEGTLRYHLDYLRRSDLIRPRKINNNRCYTCKDVDLDRSTRENACSMNEAQRKVLSVIRDDPGLTRTEVIERSRLTRRQTTRALSKLKGKGLVKVGSEGNVNFYEFADNERIFNEMMIVLMEKYLKREISLAKLKEVKRKLEGML